LRGGCDEIGTRKDDGGGSRRQEANGPYSDIASPGFSPGVSHSIIPIKQKLNSIRNDMAHGSFDWLKPVVNADRTRQTVHGQIPTGLIHKQDKKIKGRKR
jgi:hypothetical protein